MSGADDGSRGAQARPVASGLSPAQQRLLARRRLGDGATVARPSLISADAAASGTRAPATLPQRSLWFLEQLESARPVYNLVYSLRFSGPMSVPALSRSLGEVLRRHEALRTCFPLENGAPVQEIRPAGRVELPIIDLSRLSAYERAFELEDLVARLSEERFNLREGPLLRARLVRVASMTHVLLLGVHHIVFDAWSMALLAREVASHYRAFVAGRSPTLPELRVQYRAFADWQRRWLDSADGTRALAYWCQRLTGAPELLELPADHNRPPVQTYRGARCPFEVSAPVTEALRALARDEGATLYMVLLTAFKVLLAWTANETDIVVGSPVANRRWPELEPVIGFFVNMLVLRTDLGGAPTFREALRRVRETALGAYAHRDVPYEALVNALRPERNLSHNPLCQVVFVLQNGLGKLQAADLELSMPELQLGTSKFDINLTMEERDGGLIGWAEYSTDLFERPTIARFVGRFTHLLGEVTGRPEGRLSGFGVMGEQEAKEVLGWRGDRTGYGRQKSIVGAFAEVVERRPSAVAVEDGAGAWTYAELDERAGGVAARLRSEGVGVGTRVAVCMERSRNMVAALLGVLKAGGVYVPLDRTSPLERQAYVLEDAQVGAVIAGGGELEKLPSFWGPVVELEADEELSGWTVGEGKETAVGGGDGAYVMYTSGSTGRPKGVEVTHRGVVRLVRGTEYARLDAETVTMQLAPVAFDASTFELWGPLLNGGRCVLGSEGVPTASTVARGIRERGVNTLWLTSSLLSAIVDEDVEALRGLRELLAGGEALSVAHVERVLRALPETTVVNGYGPTESTTFACCHRMQGPGGLGEGRRSVPIGRPIANTEVYILDEGLRAVGVGIPGEICIGGDGLGHGYVGQAALTAERFVPNPYGDEAGGRLYRTGDVGRYLEGGEIEFLGRRDGQVKVRGYRIELGEIEAVLAEHGEVGQAVVEVRTEARTEARTERGSKRIVAWVVGRRAEWRAESGALRAYLRERLPEYMVPSVVVGVEALPLTASGKVDRRALAAMPVDAEAANAAAYEPPATEEERALAEVWAEVLGAARVGVHDNFFDLGGDSILSVRVVARARDAGLELGIEDVFQQPTLRELARAVRARPLEAARAVLAPFAMLSDDDRGHLPPGVEDAYPLTALQAGMLFHSEYAEGTAVYHDIVSFYLRDDFDPQAFEAAVSRTVADHALLRTSFNLASFSEPLQLVWREARLPVIVQDLRASSAADRRRQLDEMLEQERRLVLDWKAAPVMRMLVAVCDQATFRLTASFHHAILDGWSLATLVDELFRHYDQARGRRPDAALPPTPRLRFADFVAMERASVASPEVADFWRRTLAGCPPFRLPRPPAVRTGDDRRIRDHAVLGAETFTAALSQLASALGVPIKSVLLAAHLRVMGVISGRRDLLTGLVSSGRPEEAGGERMLGLFLNTLPLRVTLDDHATWNDLIRSTLRAERQILPHRRYPLAEIQRVVGGGEPFDVAFNFAHFHVLGELSHRSDLRLDRDEQIVETNFVLLTECWMDPGTGALKLTLSYDTEQLDGTEVECIAAEYHRALAEMTRAPAERPTPLTDVLRAEQRRRLTPVPAAADHPAAVARLLVHEAFAQQAVAAPDVVAVASPEGSLGYRELEAQSNRLARHLMEAGVGPGAVVGICLERSPTLIVAVLAVLKAGAAALPLDPAYPAERLRLMIEDSAAKLVLTEAALADAWPAGAATPRLFLDAERAAIEARSPARMGGVDVPGEALAYVIYTSGSTGRPKGVEMTHAALAALVGWQVASSSRGGGTRTLQFAPLSFDVAFQEIFATLAAGGTLVLVSEETRRDPGAVIALVAEQQIERLFLPVVMLHQLADAVDRGAALPASLREVITAGEALRITPAVARLFDKLPGARLENQYGPSETHVVTAHRLDGAPARWPALPPIGRPVAGAEIHVVDAWGIPVPPGVPGELWISGAAVGQGYRRRPEMTAERYVPAALNPAPGLRAYRTGDLALYRRDGTIEFCGRIDDQVKIRGFRVEPSEIEAVLGTCPELAQVAVTAAPGPGAERALVAYVVAAPGQAPTVDSLRRFLAARLPEHMIPSRFLTVASIALTPSGKVDRKALPDLTSAVIAPATAAEVVAPRTALERLVARVFAEVLQLDAGRVGAEQRFDTLGGHSLLAVRAIVRLREALRSEIPLRLLFRAPSPAALAAELRGRAADPEALEQVAGVFLEVGDLGAEEVARLLGELTSGGSPSQVSS